MFKYSEESSRVENRKEDSLAFDAEKVVGFSIPGLLQILSMDRDVPCQCNSITFSSKREEVKFCSLHELISVGLGATNGNAFIALFKDVLFFNLFKVQLCPVLYLKD